MKASCKPILNFKPRPGTQEGGVSAALTPEPYKFGVTAGLLDTKVSRKRAHPYIYNRADDFDMHEFPKRVHNTAYVSFASTQPIMPKIESESVAIACDITYKMAHYVDFGYIITVAVTCCIVMSHNYGNPVLFQCC